MPRHAKQEKRRVTEYLTPRDVGKILRAITDDIKARPRRRARLFMKDAIRLAVFTGLRRGEICSLRWDDVKLFIPPRKTKSRTGLYGWISVRRDGKILAKTGDEDRVPLVAISYEVLGRLRDNPNSDQRQVFFRFHLASLENVTQMKLLFPSYSCRPNPEFSGNPDRRDLRDEEADEFAL